MPIYEYRCPHCRTRFSEFYPSLAAAQVAPPARCPRCGTPGERRFSRIAVLRARASTPADAWDEHEPGAGDDWGEDSDWDDSVPTPPEDDDPQALARWARQLAAETGEPLDPLLDQALTDLEHGADPDAVMERLDRAMEDEPGPPDEPDTGEDAGGLDD